MRTWYVDPIDGTRDYLDGDDGFTVMIGLARDGIACLGVVYQPETLPIWLGITYRSPVKLNISGEANFTASPAFRPALPPDGDWPPAPRGLDRRVHQREGPEVVTP